MEDLEVRSVVGRNQLLSFVVLTFGISWAIWWGMALTSMGIGTFGGVVLNVLALSGPSITAVILSASLGGGALHRLLDGFPPTGLLSGGWLPASRYHWRSSAWRSPFPFWCSELPPR